MIARSSGCGLCPGSCSGKVGVYGTGTKLFCIIIVIIVTLHEETKHNALDINLRYRPK